MMDKMLLVDHEKCTGCRICEMVCSVSHVGACNPTKSAVRIVKWERQGLDVPVVCQQCEDPSCANICPVEAISRDADTGAMIVDGDLCVGCRMCVVACPFGAVTLDRDRRLAIKCDLCDGDPTCVRFCQPGALQFVPASFVNLEKKRNAGQKLSAVMSRALATRRSR